MKTIMGMEILEVVAIEYSVDGREFVVLEDGAELENCVDEEGNKYEIIYDGDIIVGYALA